MIKILARHVVKTDCIERFKEEAQELVEKSGAEEGNVYYTLNQSIDDPKIIYMIECWESMDHIMAHNASEHFKKFVPLLGGYCEEPVVPQLFEEVWPG